MHICYAVDTTQSTDTDCVKLYINGELQTLDTVSGTKYPSLNLQTTFNFANNHYIGYGALYANNCFDGYIAYVHFTDGTQYAATDFAENNNGVWVPKQFTGTFGSNGYHLSFADSKSYWG